MEQDSLTGPSSRSLQVLPAPTPPGSHLTVLWLVGQTFKLFIITLPGKFQKVNGSLL